MFLEGKKGNVKCGDVFFTCTLVAVIVGVYWCSTLHLITIKRVYNDIYHTFVACAFIFSDLQKENKSANHLSRFSYEKYTLFTPSAGF